MRGVSVQKGNEVRIQVDGETWAQGATVSGSVEVRGAKFPENAKYRVILAHGLERKVKEKLADAFTVLDEKTLEQNNSAQKFEFSLPLNAMVTDKTTSLYLLYGLNEGLNELGSLRLTVIPHQHIQDAIDAISVTHRFVVKAITAGKKGQVEVKFTPPSAKEFTLMKEAWADFTLTEKELLLEVTLNLEEIDTVAAGLKMKKTKKSFESVFAMGDLLHSFNQRVNKTVIEKNWQEILEQSKSNPLKSN